MNASSLHIKKYPRTAHVPWSEGATSDDKIHPNVSFFKGKMVVISTKMDGENANIYPDYFHARSLDSQSHWTQSYVRQLQGQMGHLIPKGWRVCGENLFAKHSIKYSNLIDFFLVFSIWNENNVCLSWKETEEWSELLELKTVPVIYRGIFSEDICYEVWDKLKEDGQEGYVIRLEDSFHYDDFNMSLAKFVRANHVTSENHWKFDKIEKNLLTNK